MSYDENRISDQIDGGLHYKKELEGQGVTPFETSKVKGLFVVVPKDAESFDVFSVGYTAPLEFGCSLANGKTFTLTLPQGNWQILGLLNEVSEGQALDVVDESSYHNGFYTNYTDKSVPDLNYQCPIAYTSFMTLIFSLNVPENSVVLIEKK